MKLYKKINSRRSTIVGGEVVNKLNSYDTFITIVFGLLLSTDNLLQFTFGKDANPDISINQGKVELFVLYVPIVPPSLKNK